jgi:hypothetical protein
MHEETLNGASDDMNNGSLKTKLEAAITPYFQGFMKAPGQMSLVVTVSDDDIDSVLTMAASDVAAHAQSMGKFTTAIRTLADFVDGAVGRATLPVVAENAGFGLVASARGLTRTLSSAKKKPARKKAAAKKRTATTKKPAEKKAKKAKKSGASKPKAASSGRG